MSNKEMILIAIGMFIPVLVVIVSTIMLIIGDWCLTTVILMAIDAILVVIEYKIMNGRWLEDEM